MSSKRRRFYLVAEDIMPEAMIKTVHVKDMLARGEANTVHDAVNLAGLSRSAFYKYRDLVFLYEEEGQGRLITLSLILEHRQGVLSAVLNAIAKHGGNIITINQGIPMSQAAHLTMTVEVQHLTSSVDELLESLEALQGVRKAEVVGYS
ncbi:chorismate mutase [Tumebacillus sp. BK434]|uniref:ACT domain-containing protein n=1 Tax=Tumebacillus sp. BK434 TaxID=2512169 RepID=UPI0010E9224F|nr:ACT domain-containing protein [Tumebacillus sp. BK434]TCP59639.1 chorismate mutase [Tumebacillus sp. BK434]